MLRGVSLDMLDLDDLSSLGVPSRDRDVSLLGVPHRVASCDVTSLLPTPRVSLGNSLLGLKLVASSKASSSSADDSLNQVPPGGCAFLTLSVRDWFPLGDRSDVSLGEVCNPEGSFSGTNNGCVKCLPVQPRLGAAGDFACHTLLELPQTPERTHLA